MAKDNHSNKKEVSLGIKLSIAISIVLFFILGIKTITKT